MRIVVLGAGAMGGLYGSYLSRNNDVTMVDINASVVEKINSQGFEVREPDGSSNIFHQKAVTSTDGMAPVDLIIIFLNSRFSETALNANRAIIGPDTCLMTLQNGSGHENTLGKFVPQENIIIGTTQHNANVGGPGITNHGGSGMTHIGCVTGSASRFQAIADNFTACGLQTDVSDDVQKMIWNKMFTNVSASALTAVLQMPLGYISTDPFAWDLCQKLIRETVDVAAALDMDFDYNEKVAEVKAVCDNSPNGLTSIYTDLKKGRRSEVDTISGSIVRAGEKAGVPTPNHSFMVALIHAMEDRAAK
ncbi:MAG: 2-dehydropantoate 2-reductase [Clostridia bacterium]|nr:2-dehydropantoate 2-reductase [Clostridia bacterium]